MVEVPQMHNTWQQNLLLDIEKKENAIAALALTTDTSALTAIGNDLNFKFIFSRQIEALGKITIQL